VAFKDLPIDAFPDVSSTQVKIIMKAPGMTPEEVESRIALPIEVEMLGIPKQRMLRSVSKYGIVDVTIDFEDGTDIYWARQQVAERLAGIAATCPRHQRRHGADHHAAGRDVHVHRRGRRLSLEERRSLLDWVIRPGAALGARRGRRQRPGRQGAQLRGGARPLSSWPRWACRQHSSRRPSSQQPQRRRRPPGRRRRGAAGAQRRQHQDQDDLRAIVVKRRNGMRCAWAMWPRCAKAA
jgi:cobalt-zinc-cadmium resistance protein CzcA